MGHRCSRLSVHRGHGEAKRRPALVVSSDALAEQHGIYWVVMITTSPPRDGDIAVTDAGAVGLPRESRIRAARIVALNESALTRRVGSLRPKDRAAVEHLLRRFLP